MTDSELVCLFHDWCDIYLGGALDQRPKAVSEFRQWREASQYMYDPDKMKPEEKAFLKEYHRQEALGVE